MAGGVPLFGLDISQSVAALDIRLLPTSLLDGLCPSLLSLLPDPWFCESYSPALVAQRGLSNGEAVSNYLRGRFPVFNLPPCNRPVDESDGPDLALRSWLQTTAPEMDRLLEALLTHHRERVAR